MAITDLQHTIQKFVQVTEQSFMSDFESIAKTKNFVSAGKFKAQINRTAENIYNGARSSGINNEEALEALEEAQKKLIESYTQEYQQLLKNNNQQTNADAVLAAEKKKEEEIKNNGYANVSPSAPGANATGIDIDPEIRYGEEYNLDTYATFYNGQRMGKNISSYAGTNNTFSMCDMVCQIDIVSNTGKHVVATLGKLQTLSYSIFQNKAPVRVIGNMNARDYVYGQRTIAGSLIFAVFNKHWLIDLYDKIHDTEEMKNWHFIADEIPPFNITISFANEYGYDARMAIYGVRLVNEGQTMSINDIYIENTYEYVATDIEILDSLNAWQSSDKLGRRYNTAGTVASASPQQSTPDAPKMQGQGTGAQEEKKENTEITLQVPDPLIQLTENYYKDKTEKEVKDALLAEKDIVAMRLGVARYELKKDKTTDEQKKVDEAYYKTEEQLGRVFSKQWDDITAHYQKQKKDAKTA